MVKTTDLLMAVKDKVMVEGGLPDNLKQRVVRSIVFDHPDRCRHFSWSFIIIMKRDVKSRF